MNNVSALIELNALKAEFEAMQQENALRDRQGLAPAYYEGSFFELAEKIRVIGATTTRRVSLAFDEKIEKICPAPGNHFEYTEGSPFLREVRDSDGVEISALLMPHGYHLYWDLEEPPTGEGQS